MNRGRHLGRIKSKMPNMVTMANQVASRIANMVVPHTANSIFDRLINHQKNIGTYYDPRQGMNLSVTSAPHTDIKPSSIKSLQNQLATRDDMGVKLPNLAFQPRQGVATSVQAKTAATKQHEGPEYMYRDEWQVAGGVGAAAQAGDTGFVDDNGWPVTLKQILGSRLLSRDMLEKAAISNMGKYVDVQGGTAKDREEIKYMYQRAMLEGFTRGVDITKGMTNGAIKFQIGDNISSKGSVIGVHTMEGGRDVVKFKTGFWNGKSDADQYTLFLHEVVGHSILNVNANHGNSTSAKFQQANRVMTPVFKNTITDNYNVMMDGLFREPSTPASLRVGTHDYGAPAKFEAGWFPPLTGVSSSGVPTTPNTDPQGNPVGADVKDVNIKNTTINNTFNPQEMMDSAGDMTATITAGGGGGRSAGMAASMLAPGQLSSDVMTPTKSFAAGMADLSKSNQPDMGAAGALLKSG